MRKHVVSAAILAAVIQAAMPASAATYDAFGDFSIAGNPNGPWSYGVGLTGSTFTPYAFSGANCFGLGVSCWQTGTDNPPYVAATTGEVAFSTVDVPANRLWLHPANPDDFVDAEAIVRWTAPTAGTYEIVGAFAIADTNATGTIVKVATSNSVLQHELLGPLGTIFDFDLVVTLAAGDTIDFAVNPDGPYFDDSTALSATIAEVAAVPEPVSLGLLGVGLAGLLGLRRRNA